MSKLGTALLVVLLVAAAAATGYAIRLASEPESTPLRTVPVDTTAVVRTDLVQFETLTGTLEYGDRAEVRTALAGTVTVLPEEAARLDRGDVAFELDGEPVIVMIGERPAWRDLGDGVSDGADVAQIEDNLAALGYGPDGWESDEEFDAETADAVEAWRADVGLPDGDEVELGRIVFLPASARIGALAVSTGQFVAAGAPMYATTGFDQVVSIDLDPDEIDLVEEGGAVTVILPDDREVQGTISEVGRVVRQSNPEPGSASFIEVIVSLATSELDLDQAPVDVDVESERAAGVLAVPVRALVALSDGGYAVEVDGQLIAVETGDFAGGLVEVQGALEEGDEVVIPR